MKILKASHLGMCFGVRDAIQLALQKSQSQPLTILGDLVHNESVLSHLRSQGVQMKHEVAQISTPTVMVTAHGTSSKTHRRLHQSGLNVLEATCPLVHFAHRSVQKLVQQGYHPVIVGKAAHVEVRGLTEDLNCFDVVLTEEDVRRLSPRPRFGMAAQTTQPVERVQRLFQLLRETFPTAECKMIDTVCQPTKNRQEAAINMARQSDVVVVIGGANSNNTRELAATCSRFCSRVYHIVKAEELSPDWFRLADTVGLTAGTSTPDNLIDAVERWLIEYAAFQLKLHQHLSTQSA